jgi:hypothetical protein
VNYSLIALAGLVLVVAGVSWIYPPAGMILCGLLLFAYSWIRTKATPPQQPPNGEQS